MHHAQIAQRATAARGALGQPCRALTQRKGVVDGGHRVFGCGAAREGAEVTGAVVGDLAYHRQIAH